MTGLWKTCKSTVTQAAEMSLFPLVSVTLFHEHSPNCLRYLGGKISQHFNLTMRSSESDSRDRPIVKPHLTTKLADFMSHKTRSVLHDWGRTTSWLCLCGRCSRRSHKVVSRAAEMPHKESAYTFWSLEECHHLPFLFPVSPFHGRPSTKLHR